MDTVVHFVKSLEYLRDYIKACNKPGSIYQPKVDNYKGAEIIVSGKNGTEAYGKLVAVRQSSILLYHQDCNDEPIDINCVNKFNGSDIQKVVIPGQSNVGWGVGIGLLLGITVAAIGSAGTYESYEEGISSGITSLSLGVLIAATGTIIGIVTSTPDKVIEPFSENDIKGLSAYSRYPYGEPDELKKIK